MQYMDKGWITIEHWMDEHGDRLVRTVTVMTRDEEEAQDIVQEVFIKAYRALGSYRKEASPYTFLCSIAVNLVRSRKRREHRRPKTIEFDQQHAEGNYLLPEEGLVQQEQKDLVVRGINSLSPKLKEVISLFYLSGLQIEDMGEVLGVSTGTVKSRMFRAREELKRYIIKEEAYGPS